MDALLLILGFICCLVGILGSFLPVIPGPSSSWVGLLLLYFTKTVPNNYWVLGITFLLMLAITILDYIIPSQGTKKFGGTKYGVYGTNVGLLGGLFFPPLGFIIGPFIGAFIGELLFNPSNKKGALLSATGSFLGFLASTFIKFLFCSSLFVVFIYVYFTYNS